MLAKKVFFACIAFFFLSGVALALSVPNYKGRVNDFAGMLNADQVSQLEVKLDQYDKQTSNQIAILTIHSLEGDDLEGFSIRVADSWKVGQKGKDNGVLILVALNDRKMRIEVGRGLEGSLTDLAAGRIIDGIMKPAFRKKNYYGGLNDAVSAIQLAIKGEFKADQIKRDTSYSEEDMSGYLFIYGLAMFVAGIAGFVHYILGGIVGGVGTYFLTSWLFNPGTTTLIILTIIGIFIGMIAKFILQAMAESSGSSDGGYSSSGGGGSSFSFGGGGFGGGGASGGW